ncbi:RYamide receptor [Tribolium castaneum]|uniref:RYamide receptor n=1 Tax=Tribolium castaneum TaxID=7070 RepID=RYAR_TRICA|nr:RYamide receptor [Tribolium castaneum]G4WMX4.1 RecName: Full=RYamide receptor [Tribolium castaneum]ADZ17181.1 RYamide receptor [Tribolium castaneum]|eukprot:NP_001280539.1 RYamide receptor [Tribolium castaneum]
MDANTTRNESFSLDCELVNPNSTLANVYFLSAVYSMYAIIFVVALIGNSFVCYIVLSSPPMRTVTNFFILNLAIGDVLITLLCVPFTSVSLLMQYWPFGGILCPVVNYSQALSVFVSAYTLVAISIDKYMIIMWPLKPRISKRFATYIIALVWLIAGITVLPSATFTTLINDENILGTSAYEQCDKYICAEEYSKVGQEYGDLYTKVLMFLQYVIPSLVLLFTYTSIGVVIWCHRIPGEAENSRDQRIAKNKTKMIKMMVTVVCVYTICWLPYNVLMIFKEHISGSVMVYLYFPLHGLAMSHACYNPIIYCYMNARFRNGFLQVMMSIPCLRRCNSINDISKILTCRWKVRRVHLYREITRAQPTSA